MLSRGFAGRPLAFTQGLTLCVALCVTAERWQREPVRGAEPNLAAPTDPSSERLPLAVARDRAQVMHEIYLATLDVMHKRYFHGDRAMVPARAMEDIFDEIQRQSGAEARWISVNVKPMSVHHAPKSSFEKQAATEIAAGKPEVEVVEDGYYRRAKAIPLGGGCVSCHEGFFAKSTDAPKFAGLIVSLPIQTERADAP